MAAEARLERLFRLKKNGAAVRTEAPAGLTTFLTMADIILVNPRILGAAGTPVARFPRPAAGWRNPQIG